VKQKKEEGRKITCKANKTIERALNAVRYYLMIIVLNV
jgi:hypothetical protein